MSRFNTHLRNTFLAGIFSAVPLAVTVFVIWWIDNKSNELTKWVFQTDKSIPLVGVILAILSIYLIGLITTSLIGRLLLGHLDRLLNRIPGLRSLYITWKHVSLTPGGKEGTFSKVVLIPMETGQLLTLGFTSGESIPGNPQMICVFVPGVPNPINGRMYFVRLSDCQFLDISPEEGFKVLLSTGNYVPAELGRATARMADRPQKRPV